MGSMSMYGGDIKKPMASIQLKKVAEASGLEVGETVTITVTGVVKSIDSPREDVDYGPNGSKTVMRPGCIELEVKSMKSASSEAGDNEEDM